jgi:hypothetical protein
MGIKFGPETVNRSTASSGFNPSVQVDKSFKHFSGDRVLKNSDLVMKNLKELVALKDFNT